MEENLETISKENSSLLINLNEAKEKLKRAKDQREKLENQYKFIEKQNRELSAEKQKFLDLSHGLEMKKVNFWEQIKN